MATATAMRGQAKLTPAQVRRIRKLYNRGDISQAEIGARFGVHQVTVGQIVRYETWADVE